MQIEFREIVQSEYGAPEKGIEDNLKTTQERRARTE